MIGLFDTFIDGNKKVQLKNFDPFQDTYNKGDDLTRKIQELLLPMTVSYFCIAEDLNELNVVHVKNGIFTGIDNNIEFPLFDCTGKYYDEETFNSLKEKRKHNR